MPFRYARHTADLYKIEKFYTEIVGLEKLGGFENHDGYDGIFLGYKDSNWHLEFTTSDEKPISKFDEDDCLVFYVNSEIEHEKLKQNILKNSISLEIAKNPYWRENGITISDPDGFKVVFSVLHIDLNSDDALSNLAKEKSINNWSALLDYTRKLPYGRNQNRHDFSLVLTENKGTCSSKHAILKKLADLNKVENVKLIIGLYKMNHLNTPKIGNTLLDSGLDYIPEAHCYLKINNTRIDITSNDLNIDNILNHIIEEIEIAPEQVDTFKVEYHKNYLKRWIMENQISLSFDEVWGIREICIEKLT